MTRRALSLRPSVQASVSTDGGSVGAHSDQFDVFLLQADGCKRWSISDSPEYAPDNAVG